MDTLRVKQALIQVANNENRPPFDMCIVREVANAIRDNTDHRLKSKVLAIYPYQPRKKEEPIPSRKPKIKQTDQSDEIKWLNELCKNKGMGAILADLLGCNRTKISSLKNGGKKLTDDFFNKIKQVEKRALKIFEEQETARLALSAHGTTTRYGKGCRCEPCRKAKSESKYKYRERKV